MSIDIRDRIVEFKRINASKLTPHPQNWRKHPKEQQAAMSGILKEVGYVDALMVREHDGGYQIIDGHLRAETTPDSEVPVLVVDLDDAEAALVLATFDPLSAMAHASAEELGVLLQQVNTTEPALQEMLANVASEADLYANTSGAEEITHQKATGTLAERFGVPPFSVLDARQGYWQERKRAWLALGIKSEIGRGETASTSARVGDGDQATYRTIGGKVSPGGGARPAMDYSKRQRGDGHGRPIV